MTFVRKHKFWLWFVMLLALSMPLFSGAAVHFTKPVAIAVAEDLTTAETDTTKHLTPDGALGVQWTSPVAPVAEELTTVDTDDTKHMTPDGAGGIQWASPVAEDLTTVDTDVTKRLAPDGAGGVTWSGTVNETVTIVLSPTYTLDDPTVRNIALDSRVAAITITIASSWIATNGNFVRFKDWYYSASTKNITFLTEGAELIDLETDAIMSSDGVAWTFITDSSNIGVF